MSNNDETIKQREQKELEGITRKNIQSINLVDVVNDPFKRRDSLPRTPPNTGEALGEYWCTPIQNTANGAETGADLSNTDETPEQKNEKKRKLSAGCSGIEIGIRPKQAEETIEIQRTDQQEKILLAETKEIEDKEEKEIGYYKKEVERVTKTIETLVNLVSNSSKTKIEIKTMVKKLERQIKDVNKGWNIVDNIIKNCKAKCPEKEIESKGIQVGEGDIKKEYNERRLKIEEKIKDVLEKNGEFDSLEEILEEKWPQEIYQVTEMEGISQNIIIDQQVDYAILIDPRNEDGNKILDKLVLKYDGLDELIRSNEGQEDFLIHTVNTKTSKGNKEESSSAAYLLPIEIDKTGIINLEAVYNRIKNLKDMAILHPTRIINLVVGDGLKGIYVRKICEYVFAKEQIKVKIIAQGTRYDPQKQKAKKEESIVSVKTGGKSYTDVIKTLKQEVDIVKLGVKINKIRKTEKGDLLLTVEGGEQMASTLEQEIKTKINGCQVTTKMVGTTTIYIMGMDPTTTEEDVKQAITRETKIKDSDIKIIAIRKGRFEEQTATVEVPRKQAIQLIKDRRLKVGWIDCGVKERIHVLRCFKCLEYGHKTYDCTAQIDRSGECLKCGKTGHKSKECTNREQCTKCQIEGHRADQIKCPYFKRIVEKMRREKMQSAGTGRGRIPSIYGP